MSSILRPDHLAGKSISLFHASLGENARLARQAGDKDGDTYWTALVTEVDDMIWQAVNVGFEYFQRGAGYTRTGTHNTRVHGRETASGTKPTWPSRTGCSTPPATATCSCTSTPRSPPRNPKHGTLDLAQLHAGWVDKLTRTLGVRLASIAPSVWHEAGRATTRGTTSPGPALTEADLTRAAQKAVALAQQEKSAWTRADVIKHLGRVLPGSGRTRPRPPRSWKT